MFYTNLYLLNFALKASNLFVPQLQQLQVKQIHHHFGRCHAFPFSGAFSEFTNSPGINASFWWFITSLSLHNAWSQTKNIQKYENSLPEVPQTFDGFCHISHFCTWYFPKFPSLRLPELIDSWARTSQVMARKLAKLDAQLQRSFGDICGGVVGAGGFRK